MGPNWTHAEGFILGVGAKMFTIAGPVKCGWCGRRRCLWNYLLGDNAILTKKLERTSFYI